MKKYILGLMLLTLGSAVTSTVLADCCHHCHHCRGCSDCNGDNGNDY